MAGVVSTQSPPPAPLLNNSVNARMSYLNAYNNSSNNNISNTSHHSFANSTSNNNGAPSGFNNTHFSNNNNMSYMHAYAEHSSQHHAFNQQQNCYHSVPSLRIKTNELYYKWFSEPERCEQLREVMNFIKSTNKIPKLNDLHSLRNVSRLKFICGTQIQKPSNQKC